MTTRVLVAGDHFVLSSLLRAAILHEAGNHAVEITELTLPWPHQPFGPVGEVEEASGSEADLIEALRGVEICVTQMAPLTRRVLRACPDLRLVAVSRGGPVNANLAAAAELGIAVCSAPGRNAAATAEYTVGLMLAALRRIPESHAALARGDWRGDFYAYEECGLELDGLGVGLVGYGAIGRRVARVLNAFGARVSVYDPYVDPSELAGIAEPVDDLGKLLPDSYVLSIHARATPETRGMIGRKQVTAMPQGSVLVNCARSSLVDYDAVCDALDSGHLFAAAFDVFPVEPIAPGSRLLNTRNVVLSPHLAGASRAVAEKASRIVASEVGRYLEGQPLHHQVNAQ